MRAFIEEDWNFAAWISALHAGLQAATMIGALYAARVGAETAAGLLRAADAFLIFPFGWAWSGAGMDRWEAWFFIPRAPAAILWGSLAAWARAARSA